MGANELALWFYLAHAFPLFDPKVQEEGVMRSILLLNDAACADVATAEVGVGGVVDANAG